jgi:hypothetical protein
MVHLEYAEHVNPNLRAKVIVIGSFGFMAFWVLAGFVTISLLSLFATASPI